MVTETFQEDGGGKETLEDIRIVTTTHLEGVLTNLTDTVSNSTGGLIEIDGSMVAPLSIDGIKSTEGPDTGTQSRWINI